MFYQGFIYSPTDAPVSCLKNNIKIYIKTAPTCFSAVTPSSVLHCTAVDYCQTVQHTYTNKDLICAGTPPPPPPY